MTFRGTLFPFQQTGSDWLAERTRCILADEMGLGKTIQALAALPPNMAVLVICPAVLKLNWQAEANKFRPDYRTFVAEGRKGFRFPKAGEIVIANYDILPCANTTAEQAPFGMYLIADEAHYLKGHTTQRTTKFRAIAKLARIVWGLTGTPLLSSPLDLWNTLKSIGVEKQAYGSFGQFLRLFGGVPDAMGGYSFGKPRPGAEAMLDAVMLRRTKTQVLTDLPTKMYADVMIRIDPTGKQLEALYEACGRLLEYDPDATLAKLQNDEVLSSARMALAEMKVRPAIDYIRILLEAGQPVVVFTAHRTPAILVHDAFSAYAPGLLMGDVSLVERSAAIREFQGGKSDLIVCTIQSSGIGITLTRACHCVFIDHTWVPSESDQAADRLHRIGQERPVTIHNLIANHKFDKMLASVHAKKRRWIEASVEKVSDVSADLPDLQLDAGSPDQRSGEV